MERRSIELVIAALNRAGVRYLVAGGLAVVAHGHVRLTVDIDIVLDLQDPMLETALRALGNLGYRPRAPVRLEDFADDHIRETWIRDKNLRVFSLFSPDHPMTEIDIFVEEPFDFDVAFAADLRLEVAPGVDASFVGLDDLLTLKKAAGRPKDLNDILELERLHGRHTDG